MKISISIALVFLCVLMSCKINTPKQYNNLKLSKIIASQTSTIIQETLTEDIDELNKKIKILEAKSNFMNQSNINDSLILKVNELENKLLSSQFAFVFFEPSTFDLDLISKRYIDLWLIDINLIQKPNYKINIQAFSDNSGDSLKNVLLANNRGLAVKKYLINEYCINDSNVFIQYFPNINSCNKSLYRSAKVFLIQ